MEIMPKVTYIEKKADKNGNEMKVTSFDNGAKVFVNSKYDALIYENVVNGAEFELTKDGNFDKIKYDKPNPNAGKSKMVEIAQERKAEYIKEAQDTKADSIKLAGACRDATIIVAELIKAQAIVADEGVIKEKWSEWRDWFYGQDRPIPF